MNSQRGFLLANRTNSQNMKSKIHTTNHISISVFILTCTVLLLSCGGCRSGKVEQAEPINEEHPTHTETEIMAVDTTTQAWQDQHYYRGTKVPLPDSLKIREGLGIRFWYTLPDDSYKAIVFDQVGDPKTEVTRIHFIDSLTREETATLVLYEENPYKDLPFDRISDDRLMKVDGIIRYDLREKTKEELRPFLMDMGVNMDTVTSRIVGAEVMTGNNSPEERTALANSYAIQVLDEDGQIIANQTTYKIYDRYGRQTGEIRENGHGLYQFAITRDGQHLAASFGGRYGCRSGQYITPYFKIFKTSGGEAIHREDMEFSGGIAANFNYFTLWDGGPVNNMNCNVYLLDKQRIISLNFKYPPTDKSWNENGVNAKLNSYIFKDYINSSFSFSINK